MPSDLWLICASMFAPWVTYGLMWLTWWSIQRKRRKRRDGTPQSNTDGLL